MLVLQLGQHPGGSVVCRCRVRRDDAEPRKTELGLTAENSRARDRADYGVVANVQTKADPDGAWHDIEVECTFPSEADILKVVVGVGELDRKAQGGPVKLLVDSVEVRWKRD